MVLNRRKLEASFFKGLMIASTLAVVGSLFAVFFAVILKGAPALSLSMITEVPKGGYYLGGEGGILNAIVGSLYLGIGATALALLMALPVALFLQREYIGNSRFGRLTRLSFDVLWGVPSIVYGAFGFISCSIWE
jgi:phosphate transport system permease protein